MRASGYDRAAADWYVEPAWIVDALAGAEPFSGECLDPCCGAGNIPRVLSARGIACRGSDLADRGYGKTGVDFFQTTARTDNIVSNPPYGVIEPWIEHALSLANQKVAVLARLALLEGIKRRSLFRRTPLARVWVSSRRVSMPPGGSDIPAKGGSVAFAWFVWERGHEGPPSLGWL